MPWLYDWAGEPYKTQSLVRRAILGLYDRSPSGMPGNDDLGAMSSWWVLGALGIYPAVPGTDVLALGSPLFPRARIRLGRRQLRLIAPRAAPKRPYVRALRLNGATWARPWLRFRELRRGGDLRFALSARPHRGLGRAARDSPPSFSPDGRLRCG
jgi:putative alpha-1,2-mannosidase